MMLAFALGEVIAYNEGKALFILIVPIVMLCRQIYMKVITRDIIPGIVMAFFFMFIGFTTTQSEVRMRDEIYSMEECEVEAIGYVNGITEEKTERAENITEEFNTGNIADTNMKLELRDCVIDGRECGKIIVYLEEKNKTEISGVRIGNLVKVKGEVRQFNQARNEGNFDLRKYYMSLGIYVGISGDSVLIVDKKVDVTRENLRAIKECVKEKLEKLCDNNKGIFKICNEAKKGIYEAMLLGDKGELDADIKNLYQISGIAHVLAISGLHISFVGMLVYSMIRRKFKFAPAAATSMMLVVLFAIMTGMSMSTIRAVVMFGLRLLGEVIGRSYDALTSVSIAGLLILLDNPFALFNSGVQMSFMAILAIVFVWPIVENILQVKNRALKSLLFTVTISAVLNPIIAYNYFTLPTYSFFLNIIVVPLMSVVIASGFAGIILSFISTMAGKICLLPGCLVLEGYTMLCTLVNKLPFANVIVGRPALVSMGMYYGSFALILFVISRKKNRLTMEEKEREKYIGKEGKDILLEYNVKKRKGMVNVKFWLGIGAMYIWLNSILYIPVFSNPNRFFAMGKLTVSFLDVGQGDGIFIRTDSGTNITIDGGSTSVTSVGKYRIIPFLQSKCVRRIDYAIVTHADEDHISGLVEMLEQSDEDGIKIKNLVMPNIGLKDENYNDLVQLAEDNGVKVLYIERGNKLLFNSTEIKCIYPEGGIEVEDKNDYSTVLSITIGKFSMLLTGDISTAPEGKIERFLEKQYTVLKVAHHGSKYSTSEEFLHWIMPRYSVISVGENNMYGHPSAEVLERLRKSGSIVLTTKDYGELTFTIDEKMKVESWCSPTEPVDN